MEQSNNPGVHQGVMLAEQIREQLGSEDTVGLALLLKESRTSDIAEVVALLDNDQRRVLFDLLDKRRAADVLEKVDEATREEVYEILKRQEVIELLTELGPEDGADLLGEMSYDEAQKLLKALPSAKAGAIKRLLRYSEDSAGGIMDPYVISVPEDANVTEAINKIRAAKIDEDFYSVYVIGNGGTFLGDVRIRLLLTSPEDTKISTLVDPDTIYVVADDDQERVRNLFRKNDLIVVPVLDEEHKLIGRITADRVIEVAEEEAAEDLYTMAGTDPDELESFSAFHAARIRMTWLLPCLFGTSITALVLTFFHKEFDFANMALTYTAAVVFVPMIAAISGNAGLQTSAIVVSGMAAGHLAALKVSQVFTREVRIALVVALCCGVLGGLACAVLLSTKSSVEGISVMRIVVAFSVAMFAAIMVATTLGLFLPFLFRRIGIDPAISSGPLVTTANDSISVAIYMSLTLLLLP